MTPKLPSNRKFGYLFACIFLIIAAYGFIKNGLTLIFYFTTLASSLFLILGIRNSNILTPLNKAWFLLGQIMGKVVSPIVLGIIFFFLITPIGLIAKLLGRDELKLNRLKCQTYWVDPVGSNSDSESFKNQF